ncbi:hypothetical protein [Nonomuraea aridisoli]|uniref:hypothetical protein n=1 Tax=Nonomuraea aridisoli TaxID=2070368 RepID=UPI0015E8B17F|nr:hypothetical protein [Nonomuraea aridisoli]
MSAVEAQEHQTARWVWKVSQPIQPEARKGTIISGQAKAFAQEQVALKFPVPSHLSVTAPLSSGTYAGRGFLLSDAPEYSGDTTQVRNTEGELVSEDDFREQVIADYC